jgi:hypothetical protein
MVLILIAIAGQNTHLYSNFAPVALLIGLYGYGKIQLVHQLLIFICSDGAFNLSLLFHGH